MFFHRYLLNNIVQDYGLRLFDVENLPTHGGSNRYYICKKMENIKNIKIKKSIKKEISTNFINKKLFKIF